MLIIDYFSELPAGVLVEFLVGFTNKGEVDFTLDTVDASFRYPMDFNFHIQNFSTITYNKVVKPNHEATVVYSFIPSEVFAGRPFGLNINLNYRDAVSVIWHAFDSPLARQWLTSTYLSLRLRLHNRSGNNAFLQLYRGILSYIPSLN